MGWMGKILLKDWLQAHQGKLTIPVRHDVIALYMLTSITDERVGVQDGAVGVALSNESLLECKARPW
jgi:hypothetical protein